MFQPPDVNPPAVVQPAEVSSLPSAIRNKPVSVAELRSATFQLSDASDVTPTTTVSAATKRDETPREISNRPEHCSYQVVYVNGIRTSEHDAKTSTMAARRHLGVAECEATLLYNPPENIGAAALRISGGLVSSRLGAYAEPSCVQELEQIIQDALISGNKRLIIVGHSHGTVIIQNAFDRVYDRWNTDQVASRQWFQASRNMEVILYAPLVSTIAPGPRAVGLVHSHDLPARGLGGLQTAIASTKHYAGWRESQNVETVVYTPREIDYRGLLTDPQQVHSSIDLILADREFNFRLLSADPLSKSSDPMVFAVKLADSIREGRRSDVLHRDLIIKGCELYGPSFCRPFMSNFDKSSEANALQLGKFVIDGKLLERVQAAAEQR
jgi:hypothetical protein